MLGQRLDLGVGALAPSPWGRSGRCPAMPGGMGIRLSNPFRTILQHAPLTAQTPDKCPAFCRRKSDAVPTAQTP